MHEALYYSIWSYIVYPQRKDYTAIFGTVYSVVQDFPWKQLAINIKSAQIFVKLTFLSAASLFFAASSWALWI